MQGANAIQTEDICVPLRLDSNQIKRSLPGANLIVIIFPTGSKNMQQPLTLVRQHYMQVFSNYHQDHWPPTKPVLNGWSLCDVLAETTVVDTACTYMQYLKIKNYESHKIWARWGQPLDTSFDWIVCNALSGFMSPARACTTICRPSFSVLTPASLTP